MSGNRSPLPACEYGKPYERSADGLYSNSGDELRPVGGISAACGAATTRPARGRSGCCETQLGVDVNELFIKPMKIAATVEASMEILQYDEAFVSAGSRSSFKDPLLNAQSLYLFQANATGGTR